MVNRFLDKKPSGDAAKSGIIIILFSLFFFFLNFIQNETLSLVIKVTQHIQINI